MPTSPSFARSSMVDMSDGELSLRVFGLGLSIDFGLSVGLVSCLLASMGFWTCYVWRLSFLLSYV